MDADVNGKACKRGPRAARLVAVRVVKSSIVDQRWKAGVWLLMVLVVLVYIQDAKNFCVWMMAAVQAIRPMPTVESMATRLHRRSEARHAIGRTSSTRMISVLVLMTRDVH